MAHQEAAGNSIRIACPECGDHCDFAITNHDRQQGKDGRVLCRNLLCGYRGTIAVSYGHEFSPGQGEKAALGPPPNATDEMHLVRLVIRCPYCLAGLKVRTSQKLGEALRRIYAVCPAPGCGYRGTVFLEHATQLTLKRAPQLTGIPLDPALVNRLDDPRLTPKKLRAPTNEKDRRTPHVRRY